MGSAALPYHLWTCVPGQAKFEPAFECYLGSAVGVTVNWVMTGDRLNLPIISSLTERAESEVDSGMSLDELLLFRDELVVFERYWTERNLHSGAPDGLLRNVRDIRVATDFAIANGLTLMIA